MRAYRKCLMLSLPGMASEGGSKPPARAVATHPTAAAPSTQAAHRRHAPPRPLLQVKRGIQWLAAPRQEHLRLAGVLLLRELAEAAPAIFNVHVRSFIEVCGWLSKR